MAHTINSTIQENFQIIEFTLDGAITPQEAKKLAEESEKQMQFSKNIVINGRGPIWLYAMLIHTAHPSKSVWVNDPRLGWVCVQSHSIDYNEGDVIQKI